MFSEFEKFEKKIAALPTAEERELLKGVGPLIDDLLADPEQKELVMAYALCSKLQKRLMAGEEIPEQELINAVARAWKIQTQFAQNWRDIAYIHLLESSLVDLARELLMECVDYSSRKRIERWITLEKLSAETIYPELRLERDTVRDLGVIPGDDDTYLAGLDSVLKVVHENRQRLSPFNPDNKYL